MNPAPPIVIVSNKINLYLLKTIALNQLNYYIKNYFGGAG